MSGRDTRHYRRWLTREAQAVIRHAIDLLDAMEPEPFEVVMARRSLIHCGHYEPKGS